MQKVLTEASEALRRMHSTRYSQALVSLQHKLGNQSTNRPRICREMPYEYI